MVGKKESGLEKDICDEKVMGGEEESLERKPYIDPVIYSPGETFDLYKNLRGKKCGDLWNGDVDDFCIHLDFLLKSYLVDEEDVNTQ